MSPILKSQVALLVLLPTLGCGAGDGTDALTIVNRDGEKVTWSTVTTPDGAISFAFPDEGCSYHRHPPPDNVSRHYKISANDSNGLRVSVEISYLPNGGAKRSFESPRDLEYVEYELNEYPSRLSNQSTYITRIHLVEDWFIVHQIKHYFSDIERARVASASLVIHKVPTVPADPDEK